jgi:aerobic C4-dicarboxylate transport protein
MRALRHLYVQVLIAIALGVFVGWLWPEFAQSLRPLGDGFVRLIKTVVAPVVFLTVAGGIAHMSDLRRFGRVGGKALIYFEAVSTLALILGLVVGLLVAPGHGLNADLSRLDPSQTAEFVKRAQEDTVAKHLLGLIPESFVGAFTGADITPLVLLAVLVGFAIVRMGEAGRPIAAGLDKLAALFFAVVAIVVRLAPIGAFGAMAFTVGKYGLGSLQQLGALVATFYVTAILFVLLVLGLIARTVGFSIFRFLRYIREELFIVLGTSSSESVLPQLMEKMERLGASRTVVRLVVPTGYSFNLDGTNIYMTLATLFLAQATNTPLSPGQLATLLVVAMLTSKGASGVTGSGFVVLAATIASVGSIPTAALPLVFAVDRFMSECRALTNAIGNGVAALTVARWEGELDRERLTTELASPALTPNA